MAELTVGSLFSGIGGLDLGLERAGMRVIWQSEIDPFANKVLKKHWPKVVNHGNIKEIDWRNVVRPDVLCGGYPCQPFSNAGKRRGEDDPRHLWPWVREAISRLRPDYAILENVRGHLTLGGLTVVGELATIGYDAEWRVVSAASVGANHRRDRIIIVAYPNNSRPHRTQVNTAETGKQTFCGTGRCGANVAHTNDSRSGASRRRTDRDWSEEIKGRQDESQSWTCRCCADVADANSSGWQRNRQSIRQEKAHTVFTSSSAHRSWNEIATNWQTEPGVGRVANGIPNRVDRLRGLGNAVVPQVAEVIGRLVVAHASQRP